MSDVFISYSRVDRANAEALALALRDRGVSVWYDAAIAPGAPNFATVVRQELRAAPCVVVLWTAASVASEWVYAEATEARTLRKIVLPVVVDNAEAPLPFNVAQSIQVSSGGGDGQLQRVVASVVEQLAGRQPARAQQPDRPITPADVGGRRLDARRDRADDRDRLYVPAPMMMAPVFPDEASLGLVAGRFAANGLVLDAGREGASAAYGAATVVNWSLFMRSLAGTGNGANNVESVSPRMLWHFGCLQEGPDVDEFGVGCRSVLAGWHHHGACAESLWPSAPARGDAPQPRGDWQRDAAKRPLAAYYRVEAGRIADLQFALGATGVLLVSLVAHEGWKLADSGRSPGGPISHRSLPTIGAAPQRSRFGGHAVAVIGYDEYGLLVLNTWGPSWGQRGFARLPYEQWLRFGLDAWIPILGAPVAWPAKASTDAA